MWVGQSVHFDLGAMCVLWDVYFHFGAILYQKSRKGVFKTENRVVPWFPIRHTEMSEEDHHCCDKEDCSGGCDKHHSDGEHHEEDHDERYECVVCDRTYVNIFFFVKRSKRNDYVINRMPQRNKDAHLKSKKHIRKIMVMGSDNMMFLCDVCNLEMPAYSKESHLQGKKHLKQVVQLFQNGDEFFCTVCDMTMPSYSKETHVRGRKHLRRMKLFYDPKADTYFCKICDRTMPSHARASHESGKVHLKRLGQFRIGKPVAQQNKNSTTTDIRAKASGVEEWECVICDKTIPSYSKVSHLQGRAHKRQEKLKLENKELDKTRRKRDVEKELIPLAPFDFISGTNRNSTAAPVEIDETISRKRNRVDSIEHEYTHHPSGTQSSTESSGRPPRKNSCRRERGERCDVCDLAEVVESTVLSLLPPDDD